MSKNYKDIGARIKEIINQVANSVRNNDPAATMDNLKKGFEELERESRVAKAMFEEAAKSAQDYAEELSRKAEQIRKKQAEQEELQRKRDAQRLESGSAPPSQAEGQQQSKGGGGNRELPPMEDTPLPSQDKDSGDGDKSECEKNPKGPRPPGSI